MRVGANLTKLDNLDVFIELYQKGKIDFIEILVDNFWNLDPECIFSKIKEIPNSIHIMNSLYMERDKDGLQNIAKKIQKFIEFLNPIYVSDHLFKTKEKNVIYPALIECDYKTDHDLIISKISLWQNILNSKIHIENFPSLFDSKNDQISFFYNSMVKNKFQVLFDFSNAIVSAINNQLDPDEWGGVIHESKHFHVSGYKKIKGINDIVLDTHDTRISKLTKSFVKKFSNHMLSIDATLVVEYDRNVSINDWVNDLDYMRALLS